MRATGEGGKPRGRPEAVRRLVSGRILPYNHPTPMRSLYILPRLFAAIGLVLVLIASWRATREREFIRTAARATGTVVDLGLSRDSDGSSYYYPVVRFVAASGDTVTFQSRTGSNPPSYEIGERVEVLYEAASPQNAHTATFFSLHIGSFVFGLLGVIFGAVGGIWLYVVRRAAAIAEELRRTGQRITAKVIDVELRRNIRVGSRHPWRIVAQWEDPSGAVRVFHSANIWFDPTQYVKETVDVLVDRYEPKRYLVDIDFLPRTAD